MAKFSGFAKNEGNFGSWVTGIGTFKNRTVKDENGKDVSTVDWKVTFESGDVYKFDETLFPEFPEKISEDEEYYVAIVLESDSQGEKTSKVERVDSIRPASWDYELFLVVDSTRTDGTEGDPTFYEKVSKFDEEKTVKQTNWHLEFQEGDFKGVRVPYNVHYRFQNRGDGYAGWDFTEYAYNMKNATRIHQCYEFYVDLMEVVSDDMPVEWPDDGNIVPELLARIKANKKYLRASGKNGWIISDTLKVDKKKASDQPSFDEVVKKAEEHLAETEEVKANEPVPEDW